MGGCPDALDVAAFILAILTATAAVTAGSALAAADSPSTDSVTLPYNGHVNQPDSISSYNQSESVTADVAAPQMTITIADDRDDVGLGFSTNPLQGSARNDFVQVEHHEGMDRTVTIPIRAAYWAPFPREGLQSVSESHEAELEPVTHEGAEYTLMTVHFEGEDSAVFPIPEDAVAVYSAVERTQNQTNSTFGINLGLTPTPWEHIRPEVYAGNQTAVRVEGDPDKMMIQYNAGTPDEPTWVPVPDSPTRTDPVYRMQKTGVPNATYVVSQSADPPRVRYKRNGGIGDQVSGWVTGAKHIPDRIADAVGVDVPSINLPSFGGGS